MGIARAIHNRPKTEQIIAGHRIIAGLRRLLQPRAATYVDVAMAIALPSRNGLPAGGDGPSAGWQLEIHSHTGTCAGVGRIDLHVRRKAGTWRK
jgi:hypothetical protein